MNISARTFLRFSPLVLAGIALATAAAILVIYRVDFESRRLVERNQPTYSAAVQLLVTSSSNPYLRTVAPTPPQTDGPKGAVADGIAVATPDVETLVAAANYLPFFIQSDVVMRLRDEMFGPIPGAVTAQALFARDTPRGLRPSEIPIIQVTAAARREAGAVRAAETTVAAFLRWLVSSQEASAVPKDQRVLVERLTAPSVTVVKESSTGLALLAFVCVLLGTGTLVVVLDRRRPMPTAMAASVHPDPQTVLLPLRPEPGEPVSNQAQH